jgi:HSP20 family protein
MAISRWSPVGELASLHTAMDRLFSDFFGDGSEEVETAAARPSTWYLPLDIIDAEGGYLVKAAVPGFRPEDVEVTVTDGMLSIVARHREEPDGLQGRYLRRELRLGNYARRVQLPGGIRPEDIKAGFDNGILSVEIPKAKGPQPIKIEVSGKSEKTKPQPVGATS